MKKNTTPAEPTTTEPAQLQTKGKPGELTVLESTEVALLPRHYQLDHIGAYWLLRGFFEGKAQVTAGAKPKLRLELTEGIAKDESEEFFLQNKMLVIGTGGGTFGNPTKESRMESKTEKINDLLGLKSTASRRKVIRMIKRLMEDGGTPTELPTMIRALPRVINRHGVPDVMAYILDAIQEGDIKHLSRLGETNGLESYYSDWKKFAALAKGYTDERVQGTLDKLITESAERRTKSIAELSFVVQCVVTKESGKKTAKVQEAANEKVQTLVFDLITALYLNEIVYWQAIELCKAADRHKVLMTDRVAERELKEVERKAVFICSDNPFIARASHHEDVEKIDVLVVQNPHSKNYGIYVSEAVLKHHSIIALWRMIQSLELLEMRWNPRDIPWNDLAAWKPHAELEGVWSCFMKGGRIDNGLSKEDYQSSNIQPEKILFAVQHAFYYFGGIEKWQREHRIPVVKKQRRGEHAEPAQPAPEVKPAADTSAPPADAQALAEEKKPATSKSGARKKTAKTTPPPADTSGVAGNDFAAAFAAAESEKGEAHAAAAQ